MGLGSAESDNPYANTDSAAALLETSHHPTEAIPFLESLVAEVPWNASYRLRLAKAQLAASQPDQAQANLIAVAKDASSPYQLRIEAAQTLATLKPSTTPDLGSRELTLIARPTTPADARQPYFSEARIATAALPSNTPEDQSTLLREALAIAPEAPSANSARLTLLLAQPATANPSATLAIFQSLTAAPANPQTFTSPDATTADETATGDTTSNALDTPEALDTPDPDQSNPPAASLPPAFENLDLPTKIRLATLLATAHQRDNDLTQALSYAQLAVNLAQPPTGAPPQAASSPEVGSIPPALLKLRDTLKTAVALETRNATRRPTLHEELAQSNQVRPRLTPADLAKLTLPSETQEDAQ